MSEEISAIEKEYLTREKIVFDFDDFLKHPVTSKLFFKFLHEILVPEYETFLDRLQKLKNFSSAGEALPLLQEIIKEHIETNAPQLLNLSSEMQMRCLQGYSQLLEKFEASPKTPKTPSPKDKKDSVFASEAENVEIIAGRPSLEMKMVTVQDFVSLFKTIENYVYQMLKEDVFPRFVRSSLLQKWYQEFTSQKNKTEASSILRQVCYLKSDNLKKKKEILFDESEFLSPLSTITSKEIEFFQQLREDADHWEMLEAYNNGAAGYLTTVPFVTSIKSRKNPHYSTFKYVSYLPFDLATCTLALCSRLDKTDPNVFYLVLRKFVQDSPMPASALTSLIHFGALFQKRLLNSVMSVSFDPKENEIAVFFKSSVDPSVYPKVNNTSLMTGIGCYFLKSIDGNRTKLVNIIMNNSRGILQKMSSGSMFKKILKDRRRILYSVYVEQCEQLIKNSETKDGVPSYYYHEDKFALIRSLEEYCKQHLKPEEYPKFINQPNQSIPFYPTKL